MIKKSIYISIYPFFVCLGIFLMIFSDLFERICPKSLGYADEGVAAVCILLVIVMIFTTGRICIRRYYLLLFSILVIGVFGNIFWNVQTDMKVILRDLFLFVKPYVILLYIQLTLTESRANAIYKFAMSISKALLVITAVSSVITLKIPLGMTTDRGTFLFLGEFTGVVSWWTILFLAVVCSDKKNSRLFYFLLSTLIIIRSGSGLGTLALVLAVCVYFFVEMKKKFNWYYIFLMIPLCLWIGKNEIIEYLLNDTAPRFLLFYYAFVTASNCFPLGSGFASYGSTTAISEYSKLYYEYGFNKRWGMSEEYHPFLMDSYYPQIIAQFGYFGSVLYFPFLLAVLKKIILRVIDNNCRCSCLFLFFSWCIAGFGFGTASSWGCTVYLLLPVLAVAGKSSLVSNSVKKSSKGCNPAN